MSHRHHLICVFAAVGLAVWFLVAGNGGLALTGVSLALLICPLVMGVVMWLLMRQPPSAPHQSDAEPHDDHATAARR
jgi:hypothetical protein